jgi:transcriptional regulator with XRE-family HTH domain
MPASTVTSDRARRAAFGAALQQALDVRRMTQAELGIHLDGLKQSTISAWKTGESIPDADTVFAVEIALSLRPGQLSRHLGFLPVDLIDVPVSVPEAIEGDELLDDGGKRILLAVYDELTSGPPTKQGRKPAKRPVAKKPASRLRRR